MKSVLLVVLVALAVPIGGTARGVASEADDRTIPKLLRDARSQDRAVGDAAIEVLGDRRGEGAAALTELLADRKLDVRIKAIEVLGGMRKYAEPHIVALIGCLPDDELLADATFGLMERRRVVNAMGAQFDPASVDLEPEEGERMRLEAALQAALDRLGARAVPALVAHVEGLASPAEYGYSTHRFLAAEVLEQAGTAGRDATLAALESDSESLRAMALIAIAIAGEERDEAVTAASRALMARDSSPGLERLGLRAVKELTVDCGGLGEIAGRHLDHPAVHVRVVAAAALAHHCSDREPEAGEHLIVLTTADDWRARRDALAHLANLSRQPDGTAEAVVDRLSDGVSEVQRAAVLCLQYVGLSKDLRKRAVKRLGKLARSRDELLARDAARVLARLGED